MMSPNFQHDMSHSNPTPYPTPNPVVNPQNLLECCAVCSVCVLPVLPLATCHLATCHLPLATCHLLLVATRLPDCQLPVLPVLGVDQPVDWLERLDAMSIIAVKTREASTGGYNARPANDIEHLKEDDGEEEEEDGVCGFAEPFRLSWFFTITGAEYAHVYFWILKDLSWTQELKYVSLFFGTLATLWCVVIFYHAFRTGNKDEVYNTACLFMWIFANYWWMTGETHDADYPDEPEIYEQRASESARILEGALALLTLYYFAIIPFNLMPSSPQALAAYNGFPMFKSRFSWLKTFRQYENLHMYFWLAKDLAW